MYLTLLSANILHIMQIICSTFINSLNSSAHAPGVCNHLHRSPLRMLSMNESSADGCSHKFRTADRPVHTLCFLLYSQSDGGAAGGIEHFKLTCSMCPISVLKSISIHVATLFSPLSVTLTNIGPSQGCKNTLIFCFSAVKCTQEDK